MMCSLNLILGNKAGLLETCKVSTKYCLLLANMALSRKSELGFWIWPQRHDMESVK